MPSAEFGIASGFNQTASWVVLHTIGVKMRIYMWDRIANLTHYYHSGGGLVIISDRPYQDAWDDYLGGIQQDEYDGPIVSILPEPDRSFGCDAEEEVVLIYEDAGCC